MLFWHTSFFSILYGRIIYNNENSILGLKKNVTFSISSGISFNKSYEYSLFSKRKEYNTAGLCVVSQGFFRLLPFLGVGVKTFINLNKDFPVVGVLFCIQVGLLK